MSTVNQLIQELTSCYFVTPQGALGQHQAGMGFTEDQQATQLLTAVITEISQALERDPFRDNVFISLVFPAGEDKPWKSPTITFTDYVVETLYPVHGVRTGMLTSFQKRNREHSVFQGLELLLNYRRETFPNRPVFCPVLVDRNRSLADYTDALSDHTPGPDDQSIPTLEVINLFGLTPFDNPNYALIAKLREHIAQNTINKKMRKDFDFSIDGPASAVPAQPEPDIPSIDLDTNNAPLQKNEQASDFSLADVRRPATDLQLDEDLVAESSTPTDDQSASAQTANPFIRTGEVHADHLRQFGIFAALDPDRLSQLAGQLSMETASPGTQLIVRGAVDPWFYFLVEGMVSVRADDGNSRRIEAGSEPARQPLSRLLPRKYDVTAMTAIRFIRVHEQILEKYCNL